MYKSERHQLGVCSRQGQKGNGLECFAGNLEIKCGSVELAKADTISLAEDII
jgi:hypothetical protein